MSNSQLRRDLGLLAVSAIVIGDILGSGIFYTPGELAVFAQRDWQVYFIWALCGGIVLCGALTVAELSTLFPRAGATYHMIREGWGPFWAFLKIWMEMLVSGPGSVAGIAVLFGTFFAEFLGERSIAPAAVYGAGAIVLFASINIMGVRWGGRTQVFLTTVKLVALLVLVGSALLASRPAAVVETSVPFDAYAFLRFVGMGVAAVLFTYDGWMDVTHVAGEVKDPERSITRGLVLGVLAVIVVYMVTNYAFLRMVPLEEMRDAPGNVAMTAATRALGPYGGRFLTALLMVSIFGALGGIVMTLPRLFYAGAADLATQTSSASGQAVFGALSRVSPRTAAPTAAILLCAAMSIFALLFFQTFSRIVNFFVVAAQTVNILAVSAIFRVPRSSTFRMPGYPVLPAIFVAAMILLLISAVIYNPADSAIGIALTAAGVPVYFWLKKRVPK